MQDKMKFVLCALLIGLVGTVFAVLAEKSFELFHIIYAFLGYWSVVYITAMFVVIVYITRNYFPEAAGSGMPQALSIKEMTKIEQLKRILPARLIFSKMLMVCLGLSAGATIGREGPTIQISAAIMDFYARGYDLARRKILVAIGAPLLNESA